MVVRRLNNNPSFLKRFIGILRVIYPFISAVIAVIGSVAWFKGADSASSAPLLALAVIYYWRSTRPFLLPFWTLAMLSLLQDFVSGSLLGFHFFIFLPTIILTQMKFIWRFGNLFAPAWLWFIIVVATCFSIEIVISFFIQLYQSAQIINPLDGIWRYILTWTCYPLVAWLLTSLDRWVVRMRAG